jgi:alcohol dehydrogenase
MKIVTILNPARLIIGDNSFDVFIDDMIASGKKRLFVLTAAPVLQYISEGLERLKDNGLEVMVDTSIVKEPTFEDLGGLLVAAREFKTDSVAGIGGGSVIDVAKLIAALAYSNQKPEDVIGIGQLSTRPTYLACLPTTSGTGSEVSPNSILLDEKAQLKKGIVSPFLVPDSAYIDPLLTSSVPPQITASTGLDALTHCLEAYTNIFAHPYIDIVALEGVRIIASNLPKVVKNGNDKDARAAMALGSLYGGLCLGPVNTTAVHALSYPLGGTFHIPHGIANALLLPHVMEFNIPAAPERFADIGRALGGSPGATPGETAFNGVEVVKNLIRDCGIPGRLSELEIPEDALETMASSAITVTRLLKNNVREVTYEEALNIYKKAY